MQNININIGFLNSPSAFYFSSRKGLEEFNRGWQSGFQPSVCWDLRQLTVGKINVGAVAFFLAVAHRVRHFTGQSQDILLEWHPKQFSFLSDIGFFEISDQYDLFNWPFTIGGFESEYINPSTKIMSFEQILPPPDYNDETTVAEWKQLHRETYRTEIINNCEALFSSKLHSTNRNLPLIMSRTCSELVTNSLLWGNATSFVSFQRTKSNIFINVCDIGRGFKQSLRSKDAFENLKKEDNSIDDIYAIGLGSVINENDFGLKRAISTVMDLGGDITILSNSGELHWAKPLWESYLQDIDSSGLDYALDSLHTGSIIQTSEERKKLKDRGFSRSWSSSIRGTRIGFYIPIGEGI